MLRDVKFVQEFLLHLPPTVDGLGLQMNYFTIRLLSMLCLNEMCYILFWVAFAIKLLELRRLIATEHVECTDPLRVRLGVEVSFVHICPKLCLDYICNEALYLLDDH